MKLLPCDYIEKWFLQNSSIEIEDIKNSYDVNYLQIGWIDSFDFIKMITDIEQYFKIKFKNDEFQNRSFATIDGLVHIVEVKLDG
jgi:acyl carrier protein